MSRTSSVDPLLRRILSLVSAALVFDAIVPSNAMAHFGFNDGHPTAGLGILVFGGAIAVIGILAYMAFSNKDSESEETEGE